MTVRRRGLSKTSKREASLKPASLIAVLVFSLVAAAHLVRLLFQLEIAVAGAVVPMWVSVMAFFLAVALAFALFREGQEPPA